MIGNRLYAFALGTAFAVCSSVPAIAAGFDGNWNMVAVTPSGHCGTIPIGLEISRGEFTRLVEASPVTRFSWLAAFPVQGTCE